MLAQKWTCLHRQRAGLPHAGVPTASTGQANDGKGHASGHQDKWTDNKMEKVKTQFHCCAMHSPWATTDE